MKVYTAKANESGEITLLATVDQWRKLQRHFVARRSPSIGMTIERSIQGAPGPMVRITVERSVAEVIVREAAPLP